MTTKYKYIFVFFILIGFFANSQAKAEKECFEKVSRSIFKFNEGLDKAVIGPVAAPKAERIPIKTNNF